MVTAGLTTVLPDPAPPVVKFIPAQDAAFEDHVSVVESPLVIFVKLADKLTEGDTHDVPLKTRGGVQVLQSGGLLAPLTQEGDTHDVPLKTRGGVQVLQVGGLLAPLAQEE